MRPTYISPDDALIREVFGHDAPSRRAYRARLKRAEAAGVLPRRRYLSAQRFAYRASEVEAALENLPQAHVETLGKAG